MKFLKKNVKIEKKSSYSNLINALHEIARTNNGIAPLTLGNLYLGEFAIKSFHSSSDMTGFTDRLDLELVEVVRVKEKL